MADSAAELRDLAQQIGHSAFSIAYPLMSMFATAFAPSPARMTAMQSFR
jgi:hypothetical protein